MTVLRGGPAWPPMRHPFEVAAIVAFWLIGLYGLVGRSSLAMAAVLPEPMLVVWQCGLVLAATLGGASALLAYRQPVTALLCERLFLLGIGPFALIYAGALVSRSGWEAFTPAVYFAVYAVAAVWRLYQVQKYLEWRRRMVEHVAPGAA